ncbi:MAG: ABC transporter permease [Pelotomaculum sp.]|uniref:ABC-type multidrug transport system, permease component n=1 Tax=Pelotomaculum thermopropionicum (strain DSM 13744 / JCM 10971 / SI) TaxID=370438 RepID=A5CYD3_PELTS|nr:ABC transporter permease [Pelotomaculum sp.]BAF60984.1 ABC-type multidrug transport system, permease component [Pelotomaculum thermopropionicum SI]
MIRQGLAVMRRELTRLWRDRGLRGILFLGPLLGLVLFYATYSLQVLKGIPAAVADLDRSGTSRELVEQITNAENLKVVAYPGSFAEVEELIRRGKIVAGVVIPEDFGRKVALGRQARVEMVVDGSNMIYATNATSAMLSVTRTAAAQAGIRALVARGLHPDQAGEIYQSVVFREEAWFNPALNYAFFVVLALALNVWQQCCMLAACTIVIGESGAKSWCQLRAAGVSRLWLFSCKSAVHLAVFMLAVMPLYALAFLAFKLPLNCSFPVLLLFTLAFAAALHGVGTLASSFARSAVDATRFGMIIALPSFILSGYTWPLEAMPPVLQQLVKVLPQTWFFQGLSYLTWKNPDWSFIQPYFLALLIIAAVCYGAAAVIVCRK